MCEPVTIAAIGSAAAFAASNAAAIGAVTSAASVALSAYGQNQQAKQSAAAGKTAAENANLQTEQQLIQTNQSATDQMSDRARAAMRTAGTLNAVFGDSGLTGNSQNALLAENDANAQQDISTIGRNRDNAGNQAYSQNDAMRANIQSNVNSVRRPSILGTGLQIASTGADYYSRRNPPVR